MENLLRIKKTSHTLCLLCSVLLVIIPLSVAFYWLSFNNLDWPLPRAIAGLDIPPVQPVVATTLLIGCAITMLPAALLMYAFSQLRKLFQLYSTGNIFTTANCLCLRNLSIALLAWTPTRMLFDVFISVALTSSNPPGQRYLAVSIEEREVITLLLGFVFLFIAWVMGEACRLQDENAGIV